MITTPLLLAALLVVPTFQDEELGPPLLPSTLPPLADHVVGVAGNEVILFTDLEIMIRSDRDLRERMERATTRLEQVEVRLDALSRRLESLVIVQAGQDLGFDPELVAELTDLEFDQQVESMGGHRAAAQELALVQLTPTDRKAQISDHLLGETWRRSQIGRAPGPGGRITVDRYVRPGVLRMYYDSFENSQLAKEREAVGQIEAQVRVQMLQVNVPVGGTPEDTRVQVDAFVGAYESGDASFEYLINTWGDESSRNQRGISDAARLLAAGHRLHGSDALGLIAYDGEIGDLTEPLLLIERDPSGQILSRSWCVYRLAERIPPVAALPFSSRKLQKDLTETLQGLTDDHREEVAFGRVLGETMIYPPDQRDLILRYRRKMVGR